MKQLRLPTFTQIVEKLFATPVSSNYLVVAVVIMMAGGYLAFTPNALPQTVRALVMLATLFGVARLFNPPMLRLAWTTLVVLISIIPAIDILLLFA